MRGSVAGIQMAVHQFEEHVPSEGEGMADQKENKPYIHQKIVKREKGRGLRRLILLLLCAVLFGGVVSVVFVFVTPWLNSIYESHFGTEEPDVTLPTYTEPEESGNLETSEDPSNTSEEEIVDTQPSELEALVEQILQNREITEEEYLAHYKAISQIYQTALKSLVYVQARNDERDILEEDTGTAITAALFYRTEQEIMLLTYGRQVEPLGKLEVTFPTLNVTVNGYVKGVDAVFDVAVVAVSISDLNSAYGRGAADQLSLLALGNSYLADVGTPILVVGNPYLYSSSAAFGQITSVQRNQTVTDSIYRLFYTDIQLPGEGMGFILNTSGELIGLLTREKKEGLEDYTAGIATSELSVLLTQLVSGTESTYLGITGVDITAALAEETGLPQGIYVQTVEEDSPAYSAGIQPGDVLTSISTTSIQTMKGLFNTLVSEHLPQETVVVTVMRQGKDKYTAIQFSVTLGSRTRQ